MVLAVVVNLAVKRLVILDAPFGHYNGKKIIKIVHVLFFHSDCLIRDLYKPSPPSPVISWLLLQNFNFKNA